jgi:hypothetical protein
MLRDPVRRVFPGIIMTAMMAYVCGLSFALSLSPFGGHEELFCVDGGTRPASQGDNALCDTQAVLVQFFALLLSALLEQHVVLPAWCV